MDGGSGQLIANEELVFGRPAGELPRVDGEGAAAGKHSLALSNGVFEQLAGTQIPMRDMKMTDSVLTQAVSAHDGAGILHISLYHNGIVTWRVLFGLLLALPGAAQVIEFESGGLKYQTLTRNGVTVMFAHLPTHLHDYAILQVAISNGAQAPCTIRPEDFTFLRADSSAIHAAPARRVVGALIEKGNRGDVIKLVSTYEMALYGMTRLQPTNGYEARRQQYLAEVASTKIKAAAAASVIALVQTKLLAGQSTDGAVFFPTDGKHLGAGRLIMRNSGGEFTFNAEEPESGKR